LPTLATCEVASTLDATPSSSVNARPPAAAPARIAMRLIRRFQAGVDARIFNEHGILISMK